MSPGTKDRTMLTTMMERSGRARTGHAQASPAMLTALKTELTRHRAAMTKLGMPPMTTLADDMAEHLAEGED